MSDPLQREADRIAVLIQQVAAANRDGYGKPPGEVVTVWWPTTPEGERAVTLARQRLRGQPIDLRTYPAGCSRPRAETWDTPAPGPDPTWEPGPYQATE